MSWVVHSAPVRSGPVSVGKEGGFLQIELYMSTPDMIRDLPHWSSAFNHEVKNSVMIQCQPALHLSSTCPPPVLHLPSTCPPPVFHLSSTCPPPVLHLSSTCPTCLALGSEGFHVSLANTHWSCDLISVMNTWLPWETAGVAGWIQVSVREWKKTERRRAPRHTFMYQRCLCSKCCYMLTLNSSQSQTDRCFHVHWLVLSGSSSSAYHFLEGALSLAAVWSATSTSCFVFIVHLMFVQTSVKTFLQIYIYNPLILIIDLIQSISSTSQHHLVPISWLPVCRLANIANLAKVANVALLKMTCQHKNFMLRPYPSQCWTL